MIKDSLGNAHRYDSLHPNFRSVFNILQALNLSALQNGHIELDGDYVYINIKEIKGKIREEAKLESHKRYIDIHMPLSGEETFGIKASDTCTEPTTPFDEGKDVVLYNDKPEEWITAQVGEFIIFFPEYGHAPDITPADQHQKLVVKVSVTPNMEKPTL